MTSLAVGERILWQGAPPTGLRLTAQDLFLIPFSIVWISVPATIAVTLLTAKGQHLDPAETLMIPFFLLIGSYLLFGRFVVDAIPGAEPTIR